MLAVMLPVLPVLQQLHRLTDEQACIDVKTNVKQLGL